MKTSKLIGLIIIGSLALFNLFLVQSFSSNQLSEIKRVLSEETTSSIRQKLCEQAEKETGESGLASKTGGVSDQTNKAEELDFLKNAAKGKKYLREYLYDHKDLSKFAKELAYDIIPLAVLLVLSLFGYFTYIMCYYMDCCCVKCICCKKKNDQKYSKFEMRWPIMGLILFSLWVIVASIFGLYRGVKFTRGYYLMKCQIVSFVDDFIVGAKSEKWYGLTEIKKQMNSLDSDFKNSVDQTFNVQPWMDDGYKNLQSQSAALWETDTEKADTYYKYTVIPTGTTKTSSTFFNTIWGPQSTDGTQTNLINKLVTGPIKTVYDAMYKAQGTGQEIKNSGFTDAMKSGADKIDDFDEKLQKLSKDFYKQTNDLEDVILPSIKTSANLYFGIALGVGVLSIVSAFLVSVMRLFKLRFCMHISWCVFSIWMIIGFLLSTTLYAIAVVGVQACGISDDIRKDPKYLEQLDIVNSDIIKKLKICNSMGEWKGDGEILKEFNVDKHMQNVRDLNKEMSDSLNKQQVNKDEIDKMNGYIDQSALQLKSFLDYGRWGKSPDFLYEYQVNGKQGISGNDNRVITQSCSNAKFTDGDCAATTTPIYDVLKENKSTPLCTNIHQFYNEGKSYPPNNHETCYTNPGESSYVYFNWVQQKNIKTVKKTGQLSTFKTSNTDYQSNVIKWQENVKKFSEGTVGTLLSNTEKLVDEGVNCLFVGTNLNKLMDTTCDILIPDLYWLGITLVITSVGMFCGSLFLFCAGFRFANVISHNHKAHISKKKARADKYKEN